MQLSKATIIFTILALSSTNVVAAPVNITTNLSSEVSDSTETEIVQLPFSPKAIIETVELGKDVVPIVLDDSVYFVNTTKIDAENATNSQGLQKRQADAWKWHTYLRGQPFKRSADADADADANAYYNPQARQWFRHLLAYPVKPF